MKKIFTDGLKDGLPIALGYLAVSFSFGMTASAQNVPVWVAIALSALNLTSAGQFSALTLMCKSAPLAEIAAATFVINIRYLLMSIVLSQKLVKMPIVARMAIAFGVTDEIFTVASTKPHKVGFTYMSGLILAPYFGWCLGTSLGALAGNLLGDAISSALGIGLYAMFIAIVIPEAKSDKSVAFAAGIAVAISCVFQWWSFLSSISAGWAVIIASVPAAAIAALVFPRNEEVNETQATN
ncbi:MAG: AzlC family ABC transporter permease [Eubacteriales bacterium]|nr:AzlC family ABC transporter permease [Eubacteriales bacterium]